MAACDSPMCSLRACSDHLPPNFTHLINSSLDICEII
jgi:hypothetical protein